MAKGFLVLLLCAAVMLGLAKAATFTDCGSKSGKYTKVTVSGCGDADSECILQRNTVANITIDFTSDIKSPSLTTVVHGNIAGLDMPFPLANPDACQAGVHCPIEESASYEYQASLPIMKAYPKIKVLVKWELKDDKGDDVVCVLIPARLK